MIRMVLAILCAAVSCQITLGSSVDEQLKLKTDFVPEATKPLDALIEVARRFRIPMAIEWVETTGKEDQALQLSIRNRTVAELIREIVSNADPYSVEVEAGLVRVYSPTVALHPFNFLNIQLDEFGVENADLFGAADSLRWAIRFTLEPEKYRNSGYAGGYGHGADDIFTIPKFTIRSSSLTIREALNRIALAQGNALWVVVIKSSDLRRKEPPWKSKGVDEAVAYGWSFRPLAELEQLAKERIVVDLSIEGFDDWRVTSIPVLFEHGMAGFSGGTGGFSSCGISFTYSASVEKVSKDSVTLSVKLVVKREGEPEFKFEDALEVPRNRVVEVRPDWRVFLKASIQNVEQP